MNNLENEHNLYIAELALLLKKGVRSMDLKLRVEPKAAQATLRTSQKSTFVKNYVANSAETLRFEMPVSEFITRCFMFSAAQLNANK